MGMTIDDDIEMLELIHEDYRGCRQGVALEHTINNLRKYQKIEQIIKQYKKFGNIDFPMQIISGMVEDGNAN